MEIKKELVINSPVSRVYNAITNMDELSQWFPDVVSIEPHVGGKIVFKFSSSISDLPDMIEGKITHLEKNKKLVYTWSHPDVSDFPITQVSWNLESLNKNKTRVIIVHSGFVDESTLNSYDKRWLWIANHLDTFAASQKPVSLKEQAASGWIPGVDVWAFYRIKKMTKSTAYITIPSIIATVILTSMVFSNYADFENGLLDYERYVKEQGIITLVGIGFIIGILALSNYLLPKWTREWNQQFAETEKSKPIGLFLLVGVYVFDAIVMAMFLGSYVEIPALESWMSETPDMLSLSDDLAIIKPGQWVLEMGVLVVVADTVVAVALLSAKEKGRKIAIACISVGIAFNVMTVGLFGLGFNAIALWYLFRTKTKESFKITA